MWIRRPHAAPSSHATWPLLLAVPGLVALVAEPALWLLRSWSDPSYGSHGLWIAVATGALLLTSWASGPAPRDARAARLGGALLGVTAVLRLVGRLLDVNTVGALALAVDVGAIAVLLRVSGRPFALHPAWLAALFACSLPVEHLAQRLLGHPLQLLAAVSAEALLRPVSPELVREGVLFLHPDTALAVDLPCSGARGLAVLAALGLGVLALRAPGRLGAVGVAAAVFLGAWGANVLRVLGLFAGGVAGLPMHAEPWHSGLGALALGVGALPLLEIARRAAARRPGRPPLLQGSAPWRPSGWSAAAITGLGLAVALAPHHPIDRSEAPTGRALPARIGSFAGVSLPLRDNERRYFERWGGSADKRVYRDRSGVPHTALLVRTRSPLRHLHGPDRCLVGAGHRVTRLGVRPGPVPTVVYRSTAPDGRVWRVESSFVSAGGARATTVSEVVWRWLGDPDDTWMLLQRVTPWTACERDPAQCADFATALLTVLDLPTGDPRAVAGPGFEPPRSLPTPSPPRPPRRATLDSIRSSF